MATAWDSVALVPLLCENLRLRPAQYASPLQLPACATPRAVQCRRGREDLLPALCWPGRPPRRPACLAWAVCRWACRLQEPGRLGRSAARRGELIAASSHFAGPPTRNSACREAADARGAAATAASECTRPWMGGLLACRPFGLPSPPWRSRDASCAVGARREPPGGRPRAQEMGSQFCGVRCRQPPSLRNCRRGVPSLEFCEPDPPNLPPAPPLGVCRATPPRRRARGWSWSARARRASRPTSRGARCRSPRARRSGSWTLPAQTRARRRARAAEGARQRSAGRQGPAPAPAPSQPSCRRFGRRPARRSARAERRLPSRHLPAIQQ